MKKVGIEFRPGISVPAELGDISASLSGKYRLEGSTGSWTPFVSGFTKDKDGFYSSPVTIATPGVYLFSIASTEPSIDDLDFYVTVVEATIDDVKDAIDAMQSDVTGLKTSLGALDEGKINDIATAVGTVDAKLVELKALMSDETDPAVVSLRELLNDIVAAGSSRDSVIAALTSYTDELEIIVRGDEFMEDGVTPNPFYNKTSRHVYDLLESSSTTLLGTINDIKADIIADALANRNAIETKINAMKVVVDANAALLGSTDFGLSKLKDMLVTIDQNTAGGTQSIIDLLNDAENGLSAIKVALDGKLNIIINKVDGVQRRVSARAVL